MIQDPLYVILHLFPPLFTLNRLVSRSWCKVYVAVKIVSFGFVVVAYFELSICIFVVFVFKILALSVLVLVLCPFFPFILFLLPFCFLFFLDWNGPKEQKEANRTKAPKRSKKHPRPNPPIRFYTTYILPSGGLYATYHLFTGTKKQKELTKKKAAGLYIHHLSEPDVEMRFSWVKDLAPLVVHVHLDKHLGWLFLPRVKLGFSLW